MWVLASIIICFAPGECHAGVRDAALVGRWITGSTREECEDRHVEVMTRLLAEDGLVAPLIHVRCERGGA